jgi:hypothetical protein
MNRNVITISIAVVLALTGCEATDRAEGQFIVSGERLTRLDSSALGEVRRSWSEDSVALVKKSRAKTMNQNWSLDFIATIESGGVAPCKDLRLVDIKSIELLPFQGMGPGKKVLSFAPKGFLEEWTVMACGRQRIWRVFDESTDPTNAHRILLWGAG